MKLEEILDICPKDKIIIDNLIKAYSKINSSKYKKIICTVSGGADSDIIIDICTKMDNDNKITYVWFDTGLEYDATKEHLLYLQNRYNIEIKIEKAIKPIPSTCKQYGQPFISKNVSEMISRLQKHHFKWEDKSFEELLVSYCTEIIEEEAIVNGKLKKGISKVNNRYWKGCVSALEWWCNTKKSKKMGICQNKWLKEFMIDNPPDQPISNKCCKYAKKDLAHKVVSDGKYDLEITGIRKAEGGTRSTAYKSCFDESYENCDRYRPIFWYLNDTKVVYEDVFNIKHSGCYCEYGLKRTGCAGCPFGRDFEYELSVIEQYEPKLFKAVNTIFKFSYDYTRKYRSFCMLKNKKTE